jgi:hypothetical protein
MPESTESRHDVYLGPTVVNAVTRTQCATAELPHRLSQVGLRPILRAAPRGGKYHFDMAVARLEQ